MTKVKLIFFSSVFTLIQMISPIELNGYNLPPLNLGFTSFLDGGPLKNVPGFTFQEYVQNYQSNRFLDNNGKVIPLVKDPHFNLWISISQMLLTSNIRVCKGLLGLDLVLPVVISSEIDRNLLRLRSSGGGVGDFIAGIYLQWDPIMKGDKPLMVNRIEFSVTFPTGKSPGIEYQLNPGADFFQTTAYWAATFWYTPKLSSSWRLHYLWNGQDRLTDIQAGQAIYFNYTLEYSLSEKLFAGINGYYLNQITKDKLKGSPIQNTKEKLFSIGPGVMYAASKELRFFVNFYFETYAINRPEGNRLNLRVVKRF